MRKAYMTLCFRDNIEVTYIVRDGEIIVTFEKAVGKDFVSADFLLDGTMLSNTGYSDSDIDWIRRFLKNNAPIIIKDSRGEYDA